MSILYTLIIFIFAVLLALYLGLLMGQMSEKGKQPQMEQILPSIYPPEDFYQKETAEEKRPKLKTKLGGVKRPGIKQIERKENPVKAQTDDVMVKTFESLGIPKNEDVLEGDA